MTKRQSTGAAEAATPTPQTGADTTAKIAALPIDMQRLIETALANNAAADTMTALLDWQRAEEATAKQQLYTEALIAFQSRCPVIHKSEEVKMGGERTPRYRFAPLDAIVTTIKPLMTELGLAYSFSASVSADGSQLTTTCCIVHRGGHVECSHFQVPVDGGSRMNPAQLVGSASTYAKRYALCNALGILTGDDDDDAQSLNQSDYQRAAPAQQQPPRDQQRQQPPVRPMEQQILKAATDLGYDRAKVDKWANQKYQITGGLAALGPAQLTEVLGIFREKAKTPAQPPAGGLAEKVAAAEGRVELDPAETPEQAIPQATVKTLKASMERAGRSDEQFAERFGFALAAARKSDLPTITAWIKDPSTV